MTSKFEQQLSNPELLPNERGLFRDTDEYEPKYVISRASQCLALLPKYWNDATNYQHPQNIWVMLSDSNIKGIWRICHGTTLLAQILTFGLTNLLSCVVMCYVGAN